MLLPATTVATAGLELLQTPNGTDGYNAIWLPEVHIVKAVVLLPYCEPIVAVAGLWRTVIVIALLVAVALVWQGLFAVNTQVITSPFDNVFEGKLMVEPVATLLPFLNH